MNEFLRIVRRIYETWSRAPRGRNTSCRCAVLGQPHTLEHDERRANICCANEILRDWARIPPLAP